jgi:autotransporter-associated beta strand protein
MANGKSDIKLQDDFDGQVKVEAPDFCVDGGPGRRHGSDTPYRRALVHDGNDGLVLNWDNDYQGGVTINGVKALMAHKEGVTINGVKTIATQPNQPLSIESGFTTLKAGGLEFIGAVIHLKCQPEQAGGVKITDDVQFLGGDVTFLGPATFAGPAKVKKSAPPPRSGMPDIVMEYDVFDMINQLVADVRALKEKVGIV